MKLKIEAARRQLGTALSLYIADEDPVSVHTLAGGACEVLDHFASKASGGFAFKSRFLEARPDLTVVKFRQMQKAYWNAFKHARDRNERDDEELLTSFTDTENAVHLWIGWADFGVVTGRLPIEAQLFQAWFAASLSEYEWSDPYLDQSFALFPKLKGATLAKQKAALRRRISWARGVREVREHPQTEQRPLKLLWP